MNKKTFKRGQDENHTLRGRMTGKVRKVQKVDPQDQRVNTVGSKTEEEREKSHMSWYNEGKYLHGKAAIH